MFGVSMRTSKLHGYLVAEWPNRTDECFLGALLEDFPALVHQRFVVVTSHDSGPYTPPAEERARGWRTHGPLAYSPKVDSWRSLPIDMYDEWFIFEEPPDVLELEASINLQGFSPIDYTWPEMLDRFWRQVCAVRPLHIIGDGSHLFLVTRDERIFDHVISAEQ